MTNSNSRSDRMAPASTAGSDGQPASRFESAPFAGLGGLVAAQSALLEAIEPFTEEWMRRRQEAMAAARDALSGLREAENPVAAWSILQSWWAGAAERFVQDSTDCMALSLSVLDPVSRPRGQRGEAAAKANPPEAPRPQVTARAA